MKILSIIFISIVCAFPIIGKAQAYYGQSWRIGYYGYDVKFTSNGIVHDSLAYCSGIFPNGSPYCFFHYPSSICFPNGELRYVTNGRDILNKMGQPIEGGDSLDGQKSMDEWESSIGRQQKSLFLPFANDKFYYISAVTSDSMHDFNETSLTQPILQAFDRLTYNVIDGNANSGQGKVTERMVPILKNKKLDRAGMTACRHGNGVDWWVVKLEADSNNLHLLLYKQDTVLDYGKLRFPFPWNYYAPGGGNLYGQVEFNQQGTQIAFVRENEDGDVLIADFDRCYGTCSNYKQVMMPSVMCPPPSIFGDSVALGLCFSPNGRFIYLNGGCNILQFDQWDNTFYKVADYDTTWAQFQTYITEQLGPDGKIYIGNLGGTSKQMSRIDNPDEKGIACNFCPRCLRSVDKKLGKVFSNPSNNPNYSLGAVPGGCWPMSNTDIVKTKTAWEVFPNPSSGKFHLQNVKRLTSLKELYTALGQRILSTKDIEIDASHLPKGLYFLKCEGQVRKVIIE